MMEIVATTVPCSRCGGTGNELLFMYLRCSQCDGTGYSEEGVVPTPAPGQTWYIDSEVHCGQTWYIDSEVHCDLVNVVATVQIPVYGTHVIYAYVGHPGAQLCLQHIEQFLAHKTYQR